MKRRTFSKYEIVRAFHLALIALRSIATQFKLKVFRGVC